MRTVNLNPSAPAQLVFDLVTSALLGLSLVFMAAPAVFLMGATLTFAAACCLATAVVLRWIRLEAELPRLRTITAVFVGSAVPAGMVVAGSLLVTGMFV